MEKKIVSEHYKKLKNSFDGLPDILYGKDLSGNLLFCNAAFEQIVGRSFKKLQGKPLDATGLSQPFLDLFSLHDDEVLHTGQTYLAEARIIDPLTGIERCYAYHSWITRNQDGSPQGIIGLCRDTTVTTIATSMLQTQSFLLQTANTAALLLSSAGKDLHTTIQEVLALIGEATGADIVDIWHNYDNVNDELCSARLYEWIVDKEALGDVHPPTSICYKNMLPNWKNLLEKGTSVNSSEESAGCPDWDFLSACGLSTILLIPIHFQGAFWGLIRLGIHKKKTCWNSGEEAVLRSVGILLAATLQRREIQADLSESEQRFRDVTQASGDIVWEVDASGCFTYVSDRLTQVTRYSPEEVLGATWNDLTISIKPIDIVACMFQAGLGSGSFRSFEHEIISKSGKRIWLQSSAKILIGPFGITGLRGTSHDTTQDKQISENLKSTLEALEYANTELEESVKRAHVLAEKAEAASRTKSEFLANISHEIRTPLNAILGLGYLLNQTGLNDKQSEYMDKISAAGRTLQAMLTNILDFSKLEAQQVAIEEQSFSLEQIFESLAKYFASKVDDSRLSLTFILQKNVPKNYIGDALRLRQVLSHLIDNAVKFTEQGGITVYCTLEQLQEDRAYLRFLIVDTGIGITKEQKDKLFQSFSQGDSSFTKKYGGTGLGLAISKRLLELTGGSLQIESLPDKGTRVTAHVSFPIDTALHEHSTKSPLEGQTVLIIMEEEVGRVALESILDEYDCTIHSFATPEVFLETSFKLPDLSEAKLAILPASLSNQELSELIQCNSFSSGETRILFITKENEQTLQLPSAGHVDSIDYIRKPVLSFALIRSLEHLLLGIDSHKAGISQATVFSEGKHGSAPDLEDTSDTDLLYDAPGLSIEDAINRLGGNKALFIQALNRFYQTYSGQEKTLLSLVEENADHRAATLRTLREQAVAIGAKRLLRASYDLENHLEQDLYPEHDQYIVAFMAELSHALELAVNILEESSDTPSDATPHAASLAGKPHEIQATVQQLSSLLQDDDASACTLFSTVKQDLEALAPHKTSIIAKALAVFDFSEALAALSDIERDLAE